MTMTGYESITLREWDDLNDFADERMTLKPSYITSASEADLPKDALSKGQMASKAWLYSELRKYMSGKFNIDNIVLYGCWVGTLVEPLFAAFEDNGLRVGRMYGIDIDRESVNKAEMFNHKRLLNNWNFKGVVADIDTLDSSKLEFQTESELITVSPEVIVNTSSEHMSEHWFRTAHRNQLIVMQTNNSEREVGHINHCSCLADMEARYPLDPNRIAYKGQLIMPNYTRFMQIGYRL